MAKDPRARTTTIRDVARAAGVSIATASRVFNGRRNVDAEISARVEAAVAKLRYAPNVSARNMRKGRTQTIGIIIRDITVPSLAIFVRAAQDALQEAGYTLLMTYSDDQKERELHLLNRIARQRVDGLIMTTCSETDRELLQARKALNLPVVMLDRESADADAMLISHADGMRLALDYLAALGHRRIGLITGGASVWPARERVRAYKEGLSVHHLPIDETLIRAKSFAQETAFAEASMLLGQPDRPTAIITGGTAMLPGVMQAIRARGLRIPDDISLIGGADSDLAMFASPPITVVRWSYTELGRVGARLLLERIAQPEAIPPRRILFPTEFIIRESCRAPAR